MTVQSDSTQSMCNIMAFTQCLLLTTPTTPSHNWPTHHHISKVLNLYQTNVVKMLTNFGKVVRKDKIKQPWGERLRHWTSGRDAKFKLFNQYIASTSANTMVHWGTLMAWPLHLVKIRPAYQHVPKLFPLGQRWARHASNHFTNRGSKSPNDPPNCFQARLGSALCTC